MKVIAFETSAKAVSVAITDHGVLLGEYYQNSGQTHSRTLMKMAEDLLANTDLTIADIDAVAVANGPGSFTGVRIGVSAAKGLAWGRELPCVGVSTLEGMAASCGLLQGIVCCCMDARRSQVYNALFRAENGALTRLCEDRAVAVEELGNELSILEGCKLVVGDGAELCYNALKERVEGLTLAPEHRRHQRASGIALVANRLLVEGNVSDAATLTPNYLRLSQAEREKLSKTAARP